MDHLVGLTEEARKLALDRFRLAYAHSASMANVMIRNITPLFSYELVVYFAAALALMS